MAEYPYSGSKVNIHIDPTTFQTLPSSPVIPPQIIDFRIQSTNTSITYSQRIFYNQEIICKKMEHHYYALL